MTLSPKGTLAGTLVSLLDSSPLPLPGKVGLAPHIPSLSPFLSSLCGFPLEIQISYAHLCLVPFKGYLRISWAPFVSITFIITGFQECALNCGN